jgi:hypothetical protein
MSKAPATPKNTAAIDIPPLKSRMMRSANLIHLSDVHESQVLHPASFYPQYVHEPFLECAAPKTEETTSSLPKLMAGENK